MDSDTARLVLVVALILGLAMVAMHERHYKDRRYRLLEARLSAVESIIVEDRLT